MVKSTARLKDIAANTGFSVNTVSLALRGSPRIPEETRAVIGAVAQQLNYLPNQVARSLVTQSTRSIGLILTEITNPVLTAVAQAIESELSKRGYTTLFATSNSNIELEKKMIATFRARRADGMLIFPCRHNELDHIRQLRDRNFPVVLLVGNPDAGVDAVCMDERAGALKAVTHLIANGHRRIGLIDSNEQTGNVEKRDGYCLAHHQAGIDIDPRLMVNFDSHGVAEGFRGMDLLIGRGGNPTGVFAANDSLALGAMRYCALAGLRIPQDVAIIGFDNIPYAEYAMTPLSSVNYDIGSVTRLAIDRVLDLIAAQGVLPAPRVTQFEPDLVIRDSTYARTAPPMKG